MRLARAGVVLLRFVAGIVLAALSASPSLAHELRPAYLELREGAVGEFDVLWKTPMQGGMRLSISPEFSGRTEILTPIDGRATGDASIQSWRLRAVGPMRGRTVRIRGLDSTITDALVRIEFADGGAFVARLTPQAPSVTIPAEQGAWAAAATYSALGVEHILLGVDHLLFVTGLVLIVRGRRQLVKTITAFTVAHSLTLALATLGFVSAPLAPLNAAIALSILFLGPEIVRSWRGGTSLTIRSPWIVAFAFGLLHGFGFASGLTVTGMPRAAIPAALLAFNVGVEAGQLAFVALLLAMARAFRALEMRWPVWAARAPGYAVGVCGAYWTIERTAMMMHGR